jgi:hypothetical protein
MEISYSQLNHLMKRFPDFELSYENISHNKVSSKYNVCLAVPIGKKCYIWFTFHENKDVSYMFELNREKKIIKAKILDIPSNQKLSLGTILYGTLWEDTNSTNWFVIEDIMYFQGIYMKSHNFKERLGFVYQFMCKIREEKTNKNMIFGLPVFWTVNLNDNMTEYPSNIPDNIPYPIHHIQYRSLNEIMPYLNVNIIRKIQTQNNYKPLANKIQTGLDYSKKMDLTKPQYKYKTVFQVSADIQYDIYNLSAFGKNNQPVNFGIAYIPTYKKSVFMNNLFRKIRENQNLDYIEESDDEDDFEDTNENKYVDLDKVLLMECFFHSKFKRWIPLRVVDKNTKIVHISKLIIPSKF